MMRRLTLPTATTLTMIVIVLAAISTWILPAGAYRKLTNENASAFVVLSKDTSISLPFTQRTLDSLSIKIPLKKFESGEVKKPISVPETFQRLERNPQGFIAVLQAPIKGIIDSIDIILFILIIGGFMQVFHQTGAMLKGITYLGHKMKGRERLLIVILTFIFSLLGGSYGMDVESIVFYPVLVPLFLAAGYDLMIPLAIVFGGASIGYISSFSNPFSTIIASNTLGISWKDGFAERIIYFFFTTSLFSWYLLRYANRIKKNPAASLVYGSEGSIEAAANLTADTERTPDTSFGGKSVLLLLIFFATFTAMITGIIAFDWWTTEMSALFLGSAILIAVISRMKEKAFVGEFTKGMESLLIVAVIVGLARGVTIILNEGLASDSILYYASNALRGLNPTILIVLIMLFYFLFTIPVVSSSGMAVLTMPIIGALALLMNIPGREVVNAYLYGMGVMFFITPTGSVFPALAMVNVTYKAWLKFIMPMVLLLLALSAVFLFAGIRIR